MDGHRWVSESSDTPHAAKAPSVEPPKKRYKVWEEPSNHTGLDGREGVPRAPGALVKMYASYHNVEIGKITTVTYGLSGRAKLLSYDLRHLVNYGGLLTAFTRGTTLTVDDGVLKFFLALMVLAISTACLIWASVDNLTSIDTRSIEDLAQYMNSFVPFVLGLYITLVIGRWWALRVKALGAVMDAICNTMLVVSCVLPQPENAVVRDVVVKWSMASIFLLAKAAREDESLDDLVAKGLLSASEVELLRNMSPYGRSMVMWAWIMRLTQEKFDKAAGPMPNSPKLRCVWGLCLNARDGIQTIHTYLQTQLPFAYVHLITLLVNVNNFCIAVKCGVVFIVANAKGDRQDMLYQVLQFTLVPVLYHGMLSISYLIHDPFGEDMLDYPIAAFAQYVAESCDAVMIAQEQFPGVPKSEHILHREATNIEAKEDMAAEALGEDDTASSAFENVPLADAMAEASQVIFAELRSLGEQLSRLKGQIRDAEVRRTRDAEKLSGVIMNQATSTRRMIALEAGRR
eukprot:gnl/TRDRNA2_/TRDRNA2_27446_c0_seq1.p1 gnl/TRDRNA2_/TRDRNA2_27446_c0~~gnl/TRDRNA2_/TRDRNA2_27446_c0_seq1.p1  ORF type:complete len:515 (+),score=53.86 gnl/TRDRNA2_/TRDRNA2_27446_c0_seq1:133-1677(+)